MRNVINAEDAVKGGYYYFKCMNPLSLHIFKIGYIFNTINEDNIEPRLFIMTAPEINILLNPLRIEILDNHWNTDIYGHTYNEIDEKSFNSILKLVKDTPEMIDMIINDN